MIVPVDVNRDEHGYWTHPALARSGCETPAELNYWLRTHGLECFVMTMRDEAPEAFAAGSADEAADARGWLLEPPDNDGWFLGSVHDTSYGPVCYWFRLPQRPDASAERRCPTPAIGEKQVSPDSGVSEYIPRRKYHANCGVG